MRTFEALASVSIPALVAMLVGCTTGTAAGIPDGPPGSGTNAPTTAVAEEPSTKETTTKPPSWTFFMYAQADNARSPAFAADLAKIKSAKLGANVTIVVLADWNAGMVDASAKPLFLTGTEEYTFGGGKSFPTIKREVEQDFDDPTVMSTAIARTFRDHPADHRGLIIWSRNGGDVQDAARPDAKGMSADAMKTAIKDGLAGAGLSGDDHPLDMLGFDLASAGHLEDAYAMKSFAKVFVSNASQDGSGAWAYADAFAGINATTASGADFVKLEAAAWQANANAGANGSLPRAHAAIDTTKLDVLANATDSLVLAIGSTDGALPRVATAASFASIDGADGAGRRPDFARFVSTLAGGPNMGVLTAAAENASEAFAGAFVGPQDGSAGFSIALPTAQSITNQWYSDYLATSTTWSQASRWQHLLALWAQAHDVTIPAIEASLYDDPVSAPGGVMIRVGSSANDGTMKADLSFEGDNGVETRYGDVAASTFIGGQAMVSWTKRIGAVANQPARAISLQTFAGKRMALAGRVTLGQRQIDAAVMVSGVATSSVFVLNPDDANHRMMVNGAELLMIDPAATFTPSLTRMAAVDAEAMYGEPVNITKAGVLVGTVAMPPGNYKLRVDVRNSWDMGGLATRSFTVAPF